MGYSGNFLLLEDQFASEEGIEVGLCIVAGDGGCGGASSCLCTTTCAASSSASCTCSSSCSASASPLTMHMTVTMMQWTFLAIAGTEYQGDGHGGVQLHGLLHYGPSCRIEWCIHVAMRRRHCGLIPESKGTGCHSWRCGAHTDLLLLLLLTRSRACSMMLVMATMGFPLHVHHIWHFRGRRSVQHQRHVMHSSNGVQIGCWRRCIQAIGRITRAIRVGDVGFLERLTGMRMRMGLYYGGGGEHLLEAIGCLQLLQLQVLLLQELLALQLQMAEDAVLLEDLLVELLCADFR